MGMAGSEEKKKAPLRRDRSAGRPGGHGHDGDLGLVCFIAYFFGISALASVRSFRFGPASDEAVLVSFLAFLGAACLTLLFLAMAEPYLLRRHIHRRLGFLSAVLLFLGPGYCALESVVLHANTWVMFLMFCLSGCGYGCCMLVWGRILSVKETSASARQIFADTCAAMAVMVVGIVPPEAAGMSLMAVLGVVAGAMGARRVPETVGAEDLSGQLVISDTRNAIPKSSYFVEAALWAVYGIFWSLLGDVSFSSDSLRFLTMVGALIVAVAGLSIVRLHRHPVDSLSKAFWVAVPLLVTGLVFFVAGGEWFIRVAVVLIVLSMVMSYMHLMSHFATLAHRPSLLSDQMFAWGWLSPYAGMFAGVFVGILFRSAGSGATNLFLPIAAGVLVVVVIASMHSVERIAERRRDHEAWRSAEGAQVDEPVDIEVQMGDVFVDLGLSLREKDVAALLMRGHSQAAIAGQLFVAASTVNTHVKHIYRKACVNSKQEFIDLCQQKLEEAQGAEEARSENHDR